MEEQKPYLIFEDWIADEAISRVKEINYELERLEEIAEKRISKIKEEFNEKKQKLEKQKFFELNSLKAYAMESKDKKETKTQYKLPLLSGDIVIKKSKSQVKKPKLEKDVIEERFNEYKKEKTTYDIEWAELKKKLDIVDGQVIDTETGENYSDVIEIETKDEEVIIK